MGPARKHPVIRFVTATGAVIVRHTFGGLVVQDAMRMDAVGPVAVVPEDYANGVADDRANQWTEKAEVLPGRRT